VADFFTIYVVQSLLCFTVWLYIVRSRCFTEYTFS